MTGIAKDLLQNKPWNQKVMIIDQNRLQPPKHNRSYGAKVAARFWIKRALFGSWSYFARGLK